MRYHTSILTPLVMLLCFSGCSSLGSFTNPFASGGKSNPVQAIAVWSPAARVVNGVPERGFGGRITFFNNSNKKAVKVDGDLVVFAFEEYPGRSVSDNAPDKAYPFLAEDLKKLHTYSKEVGHSYSVWIPWDNEGAAGERKNISLVVKLVPKNAPPVLSGQATCPLSGCEPKTMLADTKTSKETGDIAKLGSKNNRTGQNIDDYHVWINSPAYCNEYGDPAENQHARMTATTIQVRGKNAGAVLVNDSTMMLASNVPPAERERAEREAERMLSQYEQVSYNSRQNNDTQLQRQPFMVPQYPNGQIDNPVDYYIQPPYQMTPQQQVIEQQQPIRQRQQPNYPPPVDPRIYETGPQPTDTVPMSYQSGINPDRTAAQVSNNPYAVERTESFGPNTTVSYSNTARRY